MLRHIFRSATLAATRRPCIPSGVVCRSLFRAQSPCATTRGLQKALRGTRIYSTTKESQESEVPEDSNSLEESEDQAIPGKIETASKESPVSSSPLAQLRRYLGLDVPTASTKHIENIKDPIFIAVDAEAYERDQSKITEIGVAVLDTRDLPEDPTTWITCIEARHYRMQGRKKLVNKKFAKGCPENFIFGTSETVPIGKMPQIFKELFCQPDGLGETQGALRNVILLGHDIQGDIRYMRKLNYEVARVKSIVATTDTQTYAKELMLPIGLEKLLNALDMTPDWFHNAGNDAVYTMQAMLYMALYGHEIALPRVTKETMARLKKEREEQRAKVVHARLVKSQEKIAKKTKAKLKQVVESTANSDFENLVVEYLPPPDPTQQAIESAISAGLDATQDCVAGLERALANLEQTSVSKTDDSSEAAGNTATHPVVLATESIMGIQKTLASMQRAVELRQKKEGWIGMRAAKKEVQFQKMEQEVQAAKVKAREASAHVQPLKLQLAQDKLPEGLTEKYVRSAMDEAAKQIAEAEALASGLKYQKKEWRRELEARESLFSQKLQEALDEAKAAEAAKAAAAAEAAEVVEEVEEEEEEDWSEEAWATETLTAKAAAIAKAKQAEAKAAEAKTKAKAAALAEKNRDPANPPPRIQREMAREKQRRESIKTRFEKEKKKENKALKRERRALARATVQEEEFKKLITARPPGPANQQKVKKKLREFEMERFRLAKVVRQFEHKVQGIANLRREALAALPRSPVLVQWEMAVREKMEEDRRAGGVAEGEAEAEVAKPEAETEVVKTAEVDIKTNGDEAEVEIKTEVETKADAA